MSASPRRPAGRRSRATLLVAVCAGLLLLAPTASAVPAPEPAVRDSAGLAAEVELLTEELELLEVAAEVAIEAYNEVDAELDTLVLQEVAAQAALDDTADQLDNGRAEASQRVRALYRSGGRPELAWTVLQAGDLGDVETTRRSLAAVLAADAAVIGSARLVAEKAVTSSEEVQELRRSRSALQQDAELRRQDAEKALQAGEALLAGTDAALVLAVAAEREEAEQLALARSLQAAEDALVAARATTPDVGRLPPPIVTGDAAAITGDTAAAVQRAVMGAPTPQAAAAITNAASRLGMPYTWGATGPETFDCSGLTQWAYRQAGVGIPRTSRQQYAGLRQVPVAEAAPGDLIFYANGPDPGSIHHVALYLGDGLMLTAPRTGDVVKVAALWRTPVYGAVRPVT